MLENSKRYNLIEKVDEVTKYEAVTISNKPLL